MLFAFEKHKLSELFPGWSNTARSSDEYHHISNACRPIGQGGVAVLWSHDLDRYVKLVDDGNERILPVLFDLPGTPICVINCYLPSGVKHDAVTKYEEDLAAISELLYKYSGPYEVLLVGDMNEDHFNRNATKERLMTKTIRDHSLTDLGMAVRDKPTYVNHNLGHSSHLDHILVKPHPNGSIWSDAEVTEHDDPVNVANSSTHVPVTTTVKIASLQPVSKHKPPRSVKIRKYRWAEVDSQLYGEVLDSEITSHSLELMTTDGAITAFQHILNTAAISAVPYTDVKVSRAKKKVNWSPELAGAVAESKLQLFLWKQAGKPKGDHPLWLDKKSKMKKVRAIQRKEAAMERQKMVQDISQAAENDPKTYHYLIKRQRSCATSTTVILVNGSAITDSEEIREHWAAYYEVLSTPGDDEQTRYTQILTSYMRIISRLDPNVVVVSEEDMQELIHGLKRGKAADRDGYAAEHLKVLTPLAITALCQIFNQILKDRCIPPSLKTSYKLPIPKKGKDARLQDNHRGITIASIFSKLLELICQKYGAEDISKDASLLQFGFTRGCSPSMASLVLSESLAEARFLKTDLFIASLDARKAFDVVCHPILKLKLYQTNIKRSLWLIIDDLYTDGKEVIRWKGVDSREYTVRQGVKQGGILSPLLYKLYINNLLVSLQRAALGYHIGPVFAGAPTCADDILLISDDPFQLQAMLQVAHRYSTQHQYQIHPQKSTVTHMMKSKAPGSSTPALSLGSEPISRVASFTHLGLDWSEGKCAPDVQKRINAARGTAYQLLGVGLHGHCGMDAATAFRTIQTHVTPKLLQGLETAVLQAKDIQQLESFYRRLLRQIQSLPECTAKEAIYVLLGTVPVEALWHLKVLTMFGSICRLGAAHPLHLLAVRQTVVRQDNKHSWFTQAHKIAAKYNIDLSQTLTCPWPKLVWKKYINTVIRSWWHHSLCAAAAQKSTLQQLTLDLCPENQPHPMWTCCYGKLYQVEASVSRARLLVGRYGLQAEKSRYKQRQTSSECPLCDQASEDVIHFLASCPRLSDIRDPAVRDLKRLYTESGLEPPVSATEICSAIINGGGYRRDEDGSRHIISLISASHGQNYSYISQKKNVIKKANQLCNYLCHKLHMARDNIMCHILMSNVNVNHTSQQ